MANDLRRLTLRASRKYDSLLSRVRVTGSHAREAFQGVEDRI